MQIPLMILKAAKIDIDQPLPICSIKVGAIKGVTPADMHLNKLAALITEAECFWYESTMYVLLGVCTIPTPRPTNTQGT